VAHAVSAVSGRTYPSRMTRRKGLASAIALRSADGWTTCPNGDASRGQQYIRDAAPSVCRSASWQIRRLGMFGPVRWVTSISSGRWPA
jgi:hypothetical protein